MTQKEGTFDALTHEAQTLTQQVETEVSQVLYHLKTFRLLL